MWFHVQWGGKSQLVCSVSTQWWCANEAVIYQHNNDVVSRLTLGCHWTLVETGQSYRDHTLFVVIVDCSAEIESWIICKYFCRYSPKEHVPRLIKALFIGKMSIMSQEQYLLACIQNLCEWEPKSRKNIWNVRTYVANRASILDFTRCYWFVFVDLLLSPWAGFLNGVVLCRI